MNLTDLPARHKTLMETWVALANENPGTIRTAGALLLGNGDLWLAAEDFTTRARVFELHIKAGETTVTRIDL